MNAYARSLLVTAAILAVPLAVRAQDEHHPAAAPVKPAEKSSMDGAGMMGGKRDMMGGRHGMMSGGMMSMMSGGMPMMGMMINHPDGYLAFLKTELKITDAQAPQWNAFADAERANAKAMADMHTQMMAKSGPAATLPERLTLHETMMTAHLESLRKEKGAVTALYGVLSDDQKKTADELLSRSMGMM